MFREELCQQKIKMDILKGEKEIMPLKIKQLLDRLRAGEFFVSITRAYELNELCD